MFNFLKIVIATQDFPIYNKLIDLSDGNQQISDLKRSISKKIFI